MAKAAQSEQLRAAFERHKAQTEEHVARLERVFEEIDASPRGKTCDAIMGIIEEGQEVMKEFKGMPALDAGLLAAAQAVEHYEIARYGTLKTWASELGLDKAVKLLDQTLGEEKETDEIADPAGQGGGQPARPGCLTLSDYRRRTRPRSNTARPITQPGADCRARFCVVRRRSRKPRRTAAEAVRRGDLSCAKSCRWSARVADS